MTLRWRIALILAAVAFGIGTVASVASYVSTASQLRSSIDDTLRSRAAAVNSSDSESRGRDDHDGDEDRGGRSDGVTDCPSAGSFQPASAAQLVTPTGTITACIDGGPTLPIADPARNLSPGAISLDTTRVDGERFRILSTPWHDGGTLQIARSLHESDEVLDRLRVRLGLLVAGSTVLAAALGWAVAAGLVRPIVRLRDATHRIAASLDLSTPIGVDGPGEVGDLASSFSTMVSAVGRSQEQQRRLVADASHEMRTPLTSLRSNVELLRQIDRLPIDERGEVVSDVLADVDELSSMLAELVELASDLAAETSERLDLGDIARTVATRVQRRTGRIVTVSDERAEEVVGRPHQIERAISNLLDNAVKYSERDTAIDVVVDGRSLAVRDRGRGIPDADLERVFDRFYRAVDARTKPGSGLGLSIVSEVARVHGGSVFARNRDGGGAEVGFSLPSTAGSTSS
jgi:two-component system sensor histidine kinase MprB